MRTTTYIFMENKYIYHKIFKDLLIHLPLYIECIIPQAISKNLSATICTYTSLISSISPLITFRTKSPTTI